MTQIVKDIVELVKTTIRNYGIGKVIGGVVVQGGDSPQIAIGNSQVVLPEEAIIIPDTFKTQTIPVSLSGYSGEDEITVSGDIEIDNTLKTEERVYLLKFNDGQKFFLLGRGQVYTTEPQEPEEELR